MTIADILLKKGENFRNFEEKLTLDILKKENIIIFWWSFHE